MPNGPNTLAKISSGFSDNVPTSVTGYQVCELEKGPLHGCASHEKLDVGSPYYGETDTVIRRRMGCQWRDIG